MANSQAELEHINLQRKKHSTMNHAVSEAMVMLFTQIPSLIEFKAGVVRDDIYRADPNRKDPMTAKKVYRKMSASERLKRFIRRSVNTGRLLARLM